MSLPKCGVVSDFYCSITNHPKPSGFKHLNKNIKKCHKCLNIYTTTFVIFHNSEQVYSLTPTLAHSHSCSSWLGGRCWRHLRQSRPFCQKPGLLHSMAALGLQEQDAVCKHLSSPCLHHHIC